MSKETVSNSARPTVSAGTEQASKDARVQDRIAQRAYELYEQRGRQDGRALEDWLSAELQLVGASGK
jgi:DUF2934 family protein